MKKPKLTVKQAVIVKRKAEGKTQNEIGAEVYPNATPESAAVLVSRELKKVNVQQALQDAMAKAGITPEAIVKPVADALQAEKQNQFTGEITPDHSVRLNAAKTAATFYGLRAGDNTTVNLNFNQVAEEQRKRYGI